MRRFLWSGILVLLFTSSLSGGFAGNYVGLTTTEKWIYEEIVIDSSFNYPSWSVTYDSIPYDSVVISSFFSLDGKEAYERYSFKQHSDESTEEQRDTVYENGSDVWLKMLLYAVDTAILAYRTPLSVGDSWKLGIEGSYYGDYDSDGQEDTVNITHDSAFVVSQGNYSVPAGNFNAFRIHRRARIEHRLSSAPQPVIEWFNSFEEFVPQLGMIYDSTVVVDSVGSFETYWKFDIVTLQSYTGVMEQRILSRNPVKSILTRSSTVQIADIDIKDASLYAVDGTLLQRNIKRCVTLPGRGVYILKGRNRNGEAVIARIIYR